MGRPTHGIDLATMKMVRIPPKNRRVWYYQHDGEKPQQLVKEGKWWYYNAPKVNGGGEIGCDSLDGAKGDLAFYAGTKVWSKLVPNGTA